MDSFIRFVVKNHYAVFGPILILQYLVGSNLTFLSTSLGFVSRSQLKDGHKLCGEVLMWGGLFLVAVKGLMLIRGTVRPKIPGFMGRLIRWHWLPVMLLLMLQYSSTVKNLELRTFFGWTAGQTFQLHSYGGLLLFLYGIGLSVAQYLIERNRERAVTKAAEKAAAMNPAK